MHERIRVTNTNRPSWSNNALDLKRVSSGYSDLSAGIALVLAVSVKSVMVVLPCDTSITGRHQG
ncbi:MAG: hypothetical protein ACR5K7_04090 [Symbiopectobacterium sp.]